MSSTSTASCCSVASGAEESGTRSAEKSGTAGGSIPSPYDKNRVHASRFVAEKRHPISLRRVRKKRRLDCSSNDAVESRIQNRESRMKTARSKDMSNSQKEV